LKSEALTTAHYFNFNLQKRLVNFDYSNFSAIFISGSSSYFNIPANIKIPIFWDIGDLDSRKWQEYAQTNNLFSKFIYSREFKLIRKVEKLICERSQTVFFINDKETTLAKNALAATNIETLPAVISAAKTLPPPLDDKPRILFVGRVNYRPNTEAIDFFATQVLPLIKEQNPNCKFIVAGAGVSKKIKKRFPEVNFLGGDFELEVEYQKATLVVAPLKRFYGTPYKILEALNYAKPLVTDNLIKEVFGQHLEQAFLCASSPEEYCNQINRIINQPELAKQLSEAAPCFVLRHHSIDSAAIILTSKISPN
jgi:glycosyltransferase involved in cell wall biosynthesis